MFGTSLASISQVISCRTWNETSALVEGIKESFTFQASQENLFYKEVYLLLRLPAASGISSTSQHICPQTQAGCSSDYFLLLRLNTLSKYSSLSLCRVCLWELDSIILWIWYDPVVSVYLRFRIPAFRLFCGLYRSPFKTNYLIIHLQWALESLFLCLFWLWKLFTIKSQNTHFHHAFHYLFHNLFILVYCHASLFVQSSFCIFSTV